MSKFEDYAKGCPARFRNYYCVAGHDIGECEERECVAWHFRWVRAEAPVDHEALRAKLKKMEKGLQK